MKSFQYYAPTSLAEALALLRRHDTNAHILAGGTDLMVLLKRRKLEPAALISAKNLHQLDFIQPVGADGLKIGAFATLTAILESEIDSPVARFLSSVTKRMAGPAIRNVATIGGNLCHASPSADTAAALIALGASVSLASESEERTMPIEAFFIGPGRSARKPVEILVSIQIPDVPGRRCDYQRLSVRRAIDIAIVGVAASAVIDPTGAATDVRIAMGAVAPIPLRAKRAEAVLEGSMITEELADRAAEAASEECSPISDVRATEAYRRKMVRVLTRRALLAVSGPQDEGKG